MHPNIMPSRFINSLKTVSSRLIRKEFSIYLHPNALALWVENSAYIKEWLNFPLIRDGHTPVFAKCRRRHFWARRRLKAFKFTVL